LSARCRAALRNRAVDLIVRHSTDELGPIVGQAGELDTEFGRD
jgi:hypothetical protein